MISRPIHRDNLKETFIAKFWSRVRVGEVDQCWNWTGTLRGTGYGQIGVLSSYRGAHVVAYVICHGDIESGECVLHSCDNRLCCNPKHLSKGTKSDNNKDRAMKNRSHHPIGTLNGRCILEECDVGDIRRRGPTESYNDLAKEFGVKTVTIAQICQRKIWKHVP